ncbi:MAG: DUF3313 family protein, partial [Candidatus Omnitrophica bacterium]|nr:DUF3313 family protein [Candidatus Omnitrophota bacterium]
MAGRFVFWSLLGCLLAACASTPSLTSYLDHRWELRKGDYFERQYMAEGTHFSLYHKAKVMPVSLEYLKDPEDFEREDLRQLRTEFQSILEARLSEVYEVLDQRVQPDYQTVVISPALTYIDTPDRVTHAVSSAVILIPLTSGVSAFEAKITEGETGIILAEIAE